MRGNPYLFAGPIILLLAVTIFASRHRDREPAEPPSIYLVEAYLERDAVDGRFIGFSADERSVSADALGAYVVERANAEDAPDAIFRCGDGTRSPRDNWRLRDCAILHSSEEWRRQDPFRE